jgi:hypothetical protein
MLPAPLLVACSPDLHGGTPADTAESAAETDVDDSVEQIGESGETAEPDDAGEDAERERLYEAFYEADTVQEIAVAIDQADIDAMNADPEERELYYACTVTLGGSTFASAGIRFRGSGTAEGWNGKPSLKLKLDAMDVDQAYAGLTRFQLSSMVNDPAKARDVLARRVWADAGFPVSRANYAHVTVNETDYGLYANIEAVDDEWARHHYLDDDEGDLWQGESEADFSDAGVAHFEIEAGRGDRTRLQDAADAVQKHGDDFWTSASTELDMEQFLDVWAMALTSGNRDIYPFDLDDYFIYGVPAEDRFAFVPWSMDRTWDTATPMLWNATIGSVAVFCLYDDVCLAGLLDATSDTVAWFEDYDVSELASELYTVSDSYVAADTRMADTYTEVLSARTALTYRMGVYPDRLRAEMGIE